MQVVAAQWPLNSGDLYYCSPAVGETSLSGCLKKPSKLSAALGEMLMSAFSSV